MWDTEVGRAARGGARNATIVASLLIGVGIWALYLVSTGRSELIGVASLLAFGLCGAVALFRFLPRLTNPEVTPAILALASRGAPISVTNEIEEEFRSDSRTFTVGRTRSLTISDSWLLHRRFSGLDLINLDDVHWAFERTTTHYNWWVPIGADHMLTLRLVNGSELTVPCFHGQLRPILQEIGARASNISIGWTQELERGWELLRRSNS